MHVACIDFITLFLMLRKVLINETTQDNRSVHCIKSFAEANRVTWNAYDSQTSPLGDAVSVFCLFTFFSKYSYYIEPHSYVPVMYVSLTPMFAIENTKRMTQ